MQLGQMHYRLALLGVCHPCFRCYMVTSCCVFDIGVFDAIWLHLAVCLTSVLSMLYGHILLCVWHACLWCYWLVVWSADISRSLNMCIIGQLIVATLQMVCNRTISSEHPHQKNKSKQKKLFRGALIYMFKLFQMHNVVFLFVSEV